MQLTTLLLIIVSILTLLSGIAVLSGAHKGDRLQAFLFFFTTIFAFMWSVGIGIFLSIPSDANADLALTAIRLIYIGAPIMCWGLAAYTCHKYLLGRIAMIILGVVCAIFVIMILVDPNLASNYSLSESSGNIVYVERNPMYISYGVYHFVAVALYMIGLLYSACSTKIVNVKKANIMVLIGFTITGILALVFDFILPYFGDYATIWVGILAMSIAWIFHYYAILRYRLLDLSSPWLKSFSHIIVMSLAAITYLVVFFVIFAALFKVPTPSIQVVILNILMIVAVLLLFPILNEASTFVNSLASTEIVDVAYIVKKLTSLIGYDVSLSEVATFLSDHLHFQYIGFIVEGDLCGSKEIKLSPEIIKEISKLHKTEDNIWLKLDEKISNSLAHYGIVAIAELRNSKGKVIGQILFGNPSGHISFDKRDMIPIEVIVQVIPTVMHPGDHHIKKHLL